jgi:hypothetical protein
MAIFDHHEATQERVLSAAMGQSDDIIPEGEGIDREAAAEAIAAIDRLVAGGELAEQEQP